MERYEQFRAAGAGVATRLMGIDDFCYQSVAWELDKVVAIVGDVLAAFGQEMTDEDEQEVRTGACGVLYEDDDEDDDSHGYFDETDTDASEALAWLNQKLSE